MTRAHDYPWLLPSAVAGAEPEEDRGHRTVRDWAVDVLCCFTVVAFGLLVFDDLSDDPGVPDGVLVADLVLGLLSCAGLWLRRRHPAWLAAVLVSLAAVTPCAAGPALVALFTVAVHRPFRTVAAIGVSALVAVPVGALVRPDPELAFGVSTVTSAVVLFAVIGWGMFVRSRRQLVLSLRERARRAESEAALRAEKAQRLAREAMAREMHDVLAHRLSLLSVHAGALEFRPDAPPEEVARAAGVIRSSAHQALQDLREVIGVLRAPVGGVWPGPGEGGAAAPWTAAVQQVTGEDERPQPGLGQLPRLLGESRQAGLRVTVVDRIRENGSVPDGMGRTAYRIAQEGLTNVRKHAPGAEATVTLDGAPGTGLVIEIHNPLHTGGDGPPAIPGAGQGLIGLAERAALAGGRLDHGPVATGHFRLHAWLPWPV
ncbi:histidine kinase [Streptomyces sp. NPDC002055]|uniref:histidine kinase n=1 Tax=Streptomyces sp. NPDC002055 TaxID=3154534 RepID=UPI003329DF8C